MEKFCSVDIVPKLKHFTKTALSLIYTPGVAGPCLKIAEDKEKSFEYTNRSNSVAVVALDYEKALDRSIFLKSTLNIDAYPLCINSKNSDDIKLVVENIEPNFCGIDLSLMKNETKNINFNVKIPLLIESVPSIQEFFNPVSKNIFINDLSALSDNFDEKSLQLRKMAGGVIETELSTKPHQKPVGIISDGSAVLGLGNIGAEAGLPVMEGKAVLMKHLGGVNAMPLCLRTQNKEEIIKIVQLLENSFSAVNLEDISAPRCFEIEKQLIETTGIAIFHDDQHGTAIVVLAGLLNSLVLVTKTLEQVKIAVSGAGAAACAVVKLLVTAGAGNITVADVHGVVFKGRENNSQALEDLCEITNPNNIKGSLQDIIIDADVFIGLSAKDVLKPNMIKAMAINPIIFALANPTPEIMPDEAKKAGAYIVATGRSDFANQINNSLAFPGIFRGVIDYNVLKITNEMKVNAAIAIASLIDDEELSVDNIMPDALDPNVVSEVAQSLFV